MSLGVRAPAIIADLKHAFPARPVLALAGADDLEASLAALRAGVDGVLDTAQSPESFLAPLRTAAAGLAVVPASVLKALTEGPTRRQLDCLHRLRPADRQFWRLLADGRDAAEISRVLLVSERTAKRRITSLLQRLGVTNRVQAAALAGCCGLLDEPS